MERDGGRKGRVGWDEGERGVRTKITKSAKKKKITKFIQSIINFFSTVYYNVRGGGFFFKKKPPIILLYSQFWG